MRTGMGHRMRRGFLAGLALVILVAGVVVLATDASADHCFTAAQGDMLPNGTWTMDQDPDGDCLGNDDEARAGTKPKDPDTDGDGVSDGYETKASVDYSDGGTDPLTPATREDKFVRVLNRDFGFGGAPTREELRLASTPSGRAKLVDDLIGGGIWLDWVVNRFYFDTLGRHPDNDGKFYWVRALFSGRYTTAEVAGLFYASNEYFRRSGGTTEAWVRDLYGKLLHRTPDQPGVRYWIDRAQRLGRAAVAVPFYQSRETRMVRVQDLYQRILKRDPDPRGQAYWADVLLKTGDDIALAKSIASSHEYFEKSFTRRIGSFWHKSP